MKKTGGTLFSLAVLLLLGCFVGFKKVILFFVIALVLICGGIIFFTFRKKRSSKQAPETPILPTADPPATGSPAPTQRTTVPEGEMDYDIFEEIESGSILSYQYERDLCIIDDAAFDLIPGNGGKSIDFKPEPDNPYDENAVAIYLGSERLGYIYRGQIQDMFNDFERRGWPVRGYLNKYSIDGRKATYKIGFYKPLSEFEGKSFALVKTKKKIDDDETREDNLLNCDEGDTLQIEYDMDSESFVVYDEYGAEIGELPKSAESYIGDPDDYRLIVGTLDSCEENDSGNLKAKVTVYLIPQK